MSINTMKTLESLLSNLNDKGFVSTFSRNSNSDSKLDINIFKNNTPILGISLLPKPTPQDSNLEPTTVFNISELIDSMATRGSYEVYVSVANILLDFGFSLEEVNLTKEQLNFHNPCDGSCLLISTI